MEHEVHVDYWTLVWWVGVVGGGGALVVALISVAIFAAKRRGA